MATRTGFGFFVLQICKAVRLTSVAALQLFFRRNVYGMD